MNFRLVLTLSISFGIAIALAELLGLIPRGMEFWLWLAIGMVCAVVVARAVPERRFLHGFLTGLIGGMLSPLIQTALFPVYLSNNPHAAESMSQFPAGFSPRLLVLLATPLIGLFYGLLFGILAWLAGKLIRRPGAPEPTP